MGTEGCIVEMIRWLVGVAEVCYHNRSPSKVCLCPQASQHITATWVAALVAVAVLSASDVESDTRVPAVSSARRLTPARLCRLCQPLLDVAQVEAHAAP
jgi:hypothetical protein